jgi:hypothetical protein
VIDFHLTTEGETHELFTEEAPVTRNSMAGLYKAVTTPKLGKSNSSLSPIGR